VVVAIALALSYPVTILRRFKTCKKSTVIFDIALSGSVILYLVVNLFLEFIPPSISDELIKAFKANEQDAYFACFKNILGYNTSINQLKGVGFYLVLVLFARLVTQLAIHPRLGLVVQVVALCLDELFHLLIQVALLFTVLAFLGHWSFGARDEQYASFWLSSYTLFRFFVGEFQFPSDGVSSDYFVFVTIYIFVVFIMIVNFLLAIIVNAHTLVTSKIRKLKTEQDFCSDLWDFVINGAVLLHRRWPLPLEMIRYLETTAGEKEMQTGILPAVTAYELSERAYDRHGKRLFQSLESARDYVRFYVDKLWNRSAAMAMMEQRDSLRFKVGHYCGQDLSDPLGRNSRCADEDEDDTQTNNLESASNEIWKHLRSLMALPKQVEELSELVNVQIPSSCADVTDPALVQEFTFDSQDGSEMMCSQNVEILKQLEEIKDLVNNMPSASPKYEFESADAVHPQRSQNDIPWKCGAMCQFSGPPCCHKR